VIFLKKTFLFKSYVLLIFFILSFSNWVFAKDDSTQTIDKDTSLVLDKGLSYIINKGFTLSTAGDSTHSNVISGQGNLLISKSDTVILGGSNTLTGLITVEGTLRVTSNDALGSTAVGTTVSNSGSLELSGAIKVSDPLTLNGTGNKSGGALRNISGNNTFEGAISLGANSRINSDSGTLNLNVTSGNAVTGTYNLFFGGSGNITVSDPIATSTGTLTKDGKGTLTLSATNTYSGTTTISAGTLIVSGSLNDSTAVTVESGAKYTLGSSDTVGSVAGAGAISLGSNTLTAGGDNTSTEVSGIISGTGALTKSGTGTLTLSGTNTYSGNTTISAGVLDISGQLNTGTYAGNIANSGILIYSSDSDQTISGAISGTGALAKSGSSTLILSGKNTYSGTTTISKGTLTVTGTLSDSTSVDVSGTYDVDTSDTIASIEGSGSVDIATGVTLTAGDSNDKALTGEINGSGNFTKTGSGILTLTGTNNLSGTFTLDQGQVNINTGGSLAASTISISNGTVLEVNVAGLSSGATVTVTGTLDINEDNTILKLNGTGATDIAAGKVLTVTSSSGYTGRFKGLGQLAFSGGTTTLRASNSHSGGTNISSGTILIEDDTAVGSGKITLRGGKLASSSTDSRSLDEDLDIQGTVEIGDTTNSGEMTFSGTNRLTNDTVLTNESNVNIAALTGSSSLSKRGSGVLTLTGDSSFTGDTTISSGKLKITGRIGSSGTYSGAVVNSGELEINSSNDQVLTGIISGSGSFIKAGTSVVTLSGTNSYSGSTRLEGGKVKISDDRNIGAVPGSADSDSIVFNGGTLNSSSDLTLDEKRGMTMTGSGTIETDDATTLTYSGIITGAGALNKTGSGTLVLRGENDLTGDINVSGGLLYAGTAEDAAKTVITNNVRVNGGTLGGGGTIGGNVNASGGSLAPGNSIGTLTIDGDLTLDSSSTTNIELDASSADKIIVNGTIDLDGVLSLTVTNATYSDTTYTIIQGGTLSNGDTFASLVGGDSSNFNGGSASLSYDYDNNLVQLVITASSSSGSVRSNTSTNSLKTLADIFDNSTASTLSSLKTYWVSNSSVVDTELKEAKGTVLATSLVQSQKTHNAFQKAVSNVTSMGASSPVENFTRSGSSNLSLAELQESGLYGDRNNWSEHYDYSDTSVLGFLKNNKNKTLVSAFTSNDSAAFIRTYGAKTKRDNIGSDYTGYQNDTYGILFGEQYKMSEGNFNGYSYGLSGSDTDYNDSYGESRTYSAHSSIFKQIDEKNHAVNLIAGGYLSHTSSKRNVSVGGGIVNDTYKSSTNDFGVNASAQYTKKIKLGGWQLSPSMSLQGSYEFKDDINESGGDLALNVKNENLITLKPELGFSLDRNFSDNIDVVDQFNFSIFASQDHYIDGTTSSAKYTSDSTAFNMNTPKDHEEYVSVGLGYNFIDKKNDSNLIANTFHTESTDNDLKSNVFSVTYRKLFGGFGKGKIPPVIVQSPNKDKDDDKGVVAKTIEKVTKTLVYKKPICRPGQVYKNDRCTANDATLQLVAAKLHQIQKVEPTLGLIALRYYVEFTKFIPLITFVMFIILIYEIIRMLAVKLYRKKMFNRNFE